MPMHARSCRTYTYWRILLTKSSLLSSSLFLYSLSILSLVLFSLLMSGETQNTEGGTERKLKRLKTQDKTGTTPSKSLELASFIDHTCLKTGATDKDIERLCQQAIQYRFKAICVNGDRVKMAKRLLHSSSVVVCTVVGFPLGASTTATKVFEAQQAVQDGAVEVDMVMNVGRLKSGTVEEVKQDIKAVRAVVKPPHVLKVILETCLLSEEVKTGPMCHVSWKVLFLEKLGRKLFSLLLFTYAFFFFFSGLVRIYRLIITCWSCAFKSLMFVVLFLFPPFFNLLLLVSFYIALDCPFHFLLFGSSICFLVVLSVIHSQYTTGSRSGLQDCQREWRRLCKIVHGCVLSISSCLNISSARLEQACFMPA